MRTKSIALMLGLVSFIIGFLTSKLVMAVMFDFIVPDYIRVLVFRPLKWLVRFWLVYSLLIWAALVFVAGFYRNRRSRLLFGSCITLAVVGMIVSLFVLRNIMVSRTRQFGENRPMVTVVDKLPDKQTIDIPMKAVPPLELIPATGIALILIGSAILIKKGSISWKTASTPSAEG